MLKLRKEESSRTPPKKMARHRQKKKSGRPPPDSHKQVQLSTRDTPGALSAALGMAPLPLFTTYRVHDACYSPVPWRLAGSLLIADAADCGRSR